MGELTVYATSNSAPFTLFSVMVAVVANPLGGTTAADDNTSQPAILHFPTALRVCELWTNEQAGVPAVVCIVGESVDDESSARLAIVHVSMISDEGLLSLLTTGIDADDDRLLYEGPAPQRNRAFSEWDVDGDGKGEILLTGEGGAGGTSELLVFKLNDNGVRNIFNGASRFGFTLVDLDEDDKWEVLNPGFEFEISEDNLMCPKHFAVYSLGGDRYEATRWIDALETRTTLKSFSERVGNPLSVDRREGVLRVFEVER